MSFLGHLGIHLYNLDHVFWKLDFMENSARMRLCLRGNHKGSDHFNVTVNYEGCRDMKHDKENVKDPSNAPILAVETILMEE